MEVRNLSSRIGEFELHHISRSKNTRADYLSRAASSLADCKARSIMLLCLEKSFLTEEVLKVEKMEEWRAPIMNLLKEGTILKDKKGEARTIRMATRSLLIEDDLYKRSYEGLYFRCISEEEGKHILKKRYMKGVVATT